jgi:hypothetical protein
VTALGTLLAMSLPAENVCRECGCSDDAACVDVITGEPCGWANEEKTVCTVCAIVIAEEWLQAGEQSELVGLR